MKRNTEQIIKHIEEMEAELNKETRAKRRAFLKATIGRESERIGRKPPYTSYE